MKRLIILAIIGYAGWYGWHHKDVLMKQAPSHHAVIRNDSGEPVQHVRLTVGGQTFVKEDMNDGETTDFPFKVNADSKFLVEWEFVGRPGEARWEGGSVASGPMVMRHILTLKPQGGVVYQEQNL